MQILFGLRAVSLEGKQTQRWFNSQTQRDGTLSNLLAEPDKADGPGTTYFKLLRIDDEVFRAETPCKAKKGT